MVKTQTIAFLRSAQRGLLELRGIVKRPEFISGGLAVLASVVGVLLGIAKLPAPVIVVGTAIVATVTVLLTHAVATSGLRGKITALWSATVVLCSAIVGAYVYHVRFDRHASPTPFSAYFYPNPQAPETAPVALAPGGATAPDYAMMMAPGGRYQFKCFDLASNGSEWLLLDAFPEIDLWVPRHAVTLPEDVAISPAKDTQAPLRRC